MIKHKDNLTKIKLNSKSLNNLKKSNWLIKSNKVILKKTIIQAQLVFLVVNLKGK